MSVDKFRNELSELQKSCIRSNYNKLTKNELIARGVVIFGAGGHGKLVADALMSQGILPLCFVDKNPSFHGQKIYGIPVCPLEHLREASNAFVLLASRHIQSMLQDCADCGITDWILPSAMRDFCDTTGQLGVLESDAQHTNNIISSYALFSDDESRAISIYHKYSDLWQIPLWIHNLNCGYSLHLRHHSKVFGDTVCYALPN